MASGISRLIRRKILDHLLKISTWTAPVNLFVALFTTAPNSQGIGGVETTYTNYSRVQHNDWNAATDADPVIATNNGVITFPTCGVDGAIIVGFGLYDASIVGNFLGYGSCSETIISGTTPIFDDTLLSLSLNETV